MNRERVVRDIGISNRPWHTVPFYVTNNERVHYSPPTIICASK